MTQRIFVSYNFGDRQITNTVKQMIESWQGDIEGHIIQVENDVSYNGATAIEWELNQIMTDCDAILFVVGEHAQNSPWLEQEIELACSTQMPVLIAFLPNTNAILPCSLNHDEYLKVAWNSSELTSCLKLMARQAA